MEKEQEAIKNLTDLLKQRYEKEVTITTFDLFENIETVLSMLKEKDKEIEKLEKQSKNLDKQAQQYFEQTIYLDKQIDLMAEFIEKTGAGRKAFSCTFRKNDKCDENGCRHCIKQYFERKVKMEIEVEEYVRTKNGKIDKIINNNCYMPQYIECEKSLLYKEDIVNHSKNIIDLIEVGDYVNGKLIHKIDKGQNYCYLYYGNCKTFVDYQIKTILTKEQMEANCYTVEKVKD